MKKACVFFIMFSLTLLPLTALAHVPYFEHFDFSEERPFKVWKSIQQSIAVYSWIEVDGESPADDIDVYAFRVTHPVNVYVESLVPVCAEYENFFPWFAVVGPGLPDPGIELPFEIPPGYGALVVDNPITGEQREMFYEPFGNKWYYEGPMFYEELAEPGIYYVYYWDPYEVGGDYVAVLGDQEIWEFWDIIRALIYTPKIRRGKELHTDCQKE